MSLSISLSISLSMSLSRPLSVPLSISLSIHLSISLSIHLSISLSIHLEHSFQKPGLSRSLSLCLSLSLSLSRWTPSRAKRPRTGEIPASTPPKPISPPKKNKKKWESTSGGPFRLDNFFGHFCLFFPCFFEIFGQKGIYIVVEGVAIYIYILLECEGARKRSKTWLRGSPRRAAREPEANLGGRNATKIGVSRGLENCRKKCRFAFLAGRSVEKNGENYVFRFASGSLAALRFARFFRVFVVRSRSENRENASFLRVSRLGPVLGRFVFGQKSGCPKKCEKCLRQKNGAQLMFWSPISDHFWCTVSEGGFSCGAERVFGPL